MRTVLVLGWACALAGAGAAATQQTVAPVQASGAISGVVLDGVTQKPIAGAIVQISGTPTSPGGGPVEPSAQGFSFSSGVNGRVTLTEPPLEPFRSQRQLTDELGRFVFINLPGNMSYSLTATRNNYFDAAYGRRAPTGTVGTSRRITLVDGQWFRDARIEMLRPSAINGRVVDETGDPVVGVVVRSYTEIFVGGVKQTAAGPATLTDDRGVYRIGTLTPGRYIIAVPSVQHAVPVAMSAAEVAGMSPQAAATQDPSIRRDPSFPAAGDFRTIMTARTPPPPAAEGRPQIYPMTFYPSATNAAESSVVQLQAGEDRQAVDIQLRPAPAFRISGRLDGPPDAFNALRLRLLGAGLESLGGGSESGTALVAADGSFAFLNIPNGAYTIIGNRSQTEYTYTPPGSRSLIDVPAPPGPRFTSMSSSSVDSGPPGTAMTRRTIQGNQRYQARQAVTVSGRDVVDLLVPMQSGVSMRGEIVIESELPANVQSQMFTSLRAEPANGDPTLGQPSFSRTSAQAREFVLEGLLPGAYLLRGPTTIKSIMWNGRDYLGMPFDTTTGRDITGVVVTLTDKLTTLSGAIRDRTGQPAVNTAVIAFPADRARWTNYGVQPAHIRSSPGSTGGAYSFRGLPAGDYLLIAVGDDQANRWKDPTFLESASRVATRLSLAWGETKALDLILQEIK